MPIPSPMPGQTKGAYIQSCMVDPVMKAEYPSEPQRYAVCVARWDERATRSNAGGWTVTPFPS